MHINDIKMKILTPRPFIPWIRKMKNNHPSNEQY